MEFVTFYAMKAVEITIAVFVVAAIVYTVEKVLGLNQRPRPGQTE